MSGYRIVAQAPTALIPVMVFHFLGPPSDQQYRVPEGPSLQASGRAHSRRHDRLARSVKGPLAARRVPVVSARTG